MNTLIFLPLTHPTSISSYFKNLFIVHPEEILCTMCATGRRKGKQKENPMFFY